MTSVLNQALLVLVPLAYLSALFGYARRMDSRNFEERRKESRTESGGRRGSDHDILLERWRHPLAYLGVALVLHATSLVVRYFMIEQLPWTNTFDVLSALSFLMAFTYFMVELATRVGSTGIDLLWLPFFMATYALAFGPTEPIANPKTDSTEFALHTVPAVSALAALLVSGLYGMLYLRLARAMRKKDFGRLFRRMPSLETLARMNLWAAAIGFLLVTIGIGVGATLYNDTVGKLDVFEPKVFVTLVVWTVLLLPMGGKLTGRWSDRATAIVSVITVAVIVASIVVATLPFLSFGR